MEVDNNSVKTEMLNERIRKSPNNICIAVEVCVVCGDRASGRHYGAISCEGCKGFFKRSIRKQLGYQCRGSRSCEVTKHHRNRCQYCRLQKCLASGMRSDSVQHERKPIVVKKELANSIANNNNFNSNNNNPNKIFIRKDLNTEALTRLPAAFNPCEQLGLSFINNRIAMLPAASNSTSEVIPSYHLSPSQASNDDDLSLDSNNASSTDYMEAVHLARDQKIISKALANVARIQSIQDISADFSQQTSEEAECYNYEAPILQDERHIDFVMHPHRSHLNPVLNDHYSCETASRLLYATVYWVRHFPPFQYLPADIRIAIVQGCWAELFTLALAQRAPDLNMNLIYSTLTGHMQKLIEQGQVSARKIKQVSDHIVNLQEYVGSMRKLNVNEHEYAYLRVLTLFSIDRPDVLLNRHIERIQEKTVHDLIAYAKANHPNEPDRFPKLLLRLLPLRALKSSIIEELFFVNVLGQMEISVCIPYLVTTENDVTTPHFLRAIKSEQPEEFAC